MKKKIIVALYDHFKDAQAAAAAIVQAGAAADRIALLANDSNGDHPALSINPAYAREQFDEDSNKQPRFVTLGEVGIGIGGVLGFLAYVSPVAIPGVAAMAANGVWVPVVVAAVIGGIVGVVVGLLTDHGVSGADTALYAEGLKRGGTLITVTVSDDLAGKVSAALKGHNAAKVEERPADWSAAGWVSLDTHRPATPHGNFAQAQLDDRA
jgi:hypothetical protein